jgi:transposase
MKPPIFVRKLSEKERDSLQAGLRSRETFVMRRSQILLASARGSSPPKIAQSLGCASQTARNAIRAFNEKGLDALIAGSSTPKRVYPAFDANSAERLRGMLHRSPREFGYETSLWTLQMAAEAAFEEGLGGDHPRHPLAASGHTLAAGQAVDQLPRPPLRTKKRLASLATD